MVMTAMPVKAQTDITFSIEDASPFNDGVFEGWGTSFCWWANRLGYSDVLSEKSAELFYDPEEGLGMNIIRYNIGGGDDPAHHHITRTDSMVPGYAVNPVVKDGTYSWDYDWNADANQRNVLFKVMEKYSEGLIVEGFSNSPPYFMTESGCSSGAVLAADNNLKDDAYTAFAKYLADVAEHFDKEWGVRFQSLTAMNEPDTDYWHAESDKQEGCHFDPGEPQSEIIIDLREALDEKGYQDMIIPGTDETSFDTQKLSYYQLSDEAKDAVDRIDTHSYQGSNYAAMKKTAVNAEKNLWMSEVDGGDTAGSNAGEMGAGLWLSKKIIADMNGLTPSAWILWQVIDSHISSEGYMGNKDTGMVNTDGGFWGLAVADHDKEEIILTMKYYSMGQFTRYIRPGDTVVAGDRNSIAAFNIKDKRAVAVIVNDTEEDQEYSVDISSFGMDLKNVQPVRTSGSMKDGEKWQELDTLKAVDGKFTASLKGNSVTTFIITE